MKLFDSVILRFARAHRELMIWCTAVLVLLSGCRVQAGNPQSGKPKNPGTVTVALADAPVDELESVIVVVQGVAFAAAGTGRCLKDPRYGCADSDLQTFYFDGETEVDLLTLSGGKSQTLPFSEELSAGTYEGIRLFLSPNKPVRGRLKSTGDEMIINFPLSPFGRKEFTIQEEFDVEEGVENEILIHVDLRRSLQKSPDGRYQLMPFTHVVPTRIAAALFGAVPTDVTRVCAYNVGGKRRHGHGLRLSPDDLSAWQHPAGPLHMRTSHSVGLSRPPLFDPNHVGRVPGRPDETDSCDNAESVGDPIDGQYELFHLPPVTYVLRAFRSDGTYFDTQVSESLLPRERRLVDVSP